MLRIRVRNLYLFFSICLRLDNFLDEGTQHKKVVFFLDYCIPVLTNINPNNNGY